MKDKANVISHKEPQPNVDPALEITHDVFVVGFPQGLCRQGPIPVWKRGTIASEPAIPIAEAQVFLVDATSKEGMSGSPVFFVSSGGYRTQSGTQMIAASIKKLIGVYAGREGSTQDETIAQLSRVWHLGCLDEVIVDPVAGSFEIL